MAPLIGYGQTIPGEITAAAGNEHTFTGCAGEGVGMSVTANDFSPRIEIYYADEVDPLATATAKSDTGSNTVILEEVTLPASGRYTIVVNGRNRADRGGYSLTLEGVGAEGSSLDDGPTALNLAVDQVVDGTLRAARSDEWIFRGCEGDAIRAQLTGDGFTPRLTLYDSSESGPLATSVANDANDASRNGVTVALRHTLPATGPYLLVAAGATRSEFGNYNLGLYLDSTDEPTVEPTAEVTVEITAEATTQATATTVATSAASPTATPNPTRTGGPQVRRGGGSTPDPNQAPAQRPTTPVATPTPTPPPGFVMPGMGESAFRILDISSENGPANYVAYAPDGDSFASAGEDGVVHIWDAFDGELLQSMVGHEDRANTVAFAADGELLASAGDDGTVRLWNPNTGESVAELIMPNNDVTSVAFSPDGTQLVATSDAGDVIIWDVAERSVLQELTGQEGPVYHASFSPDGLSVAAGDANGTVRIWAVADGEMLHTMPVNSGPGGGDPILSVAFSSDSQALVVGGVIGINDASVHIWEIESEEEIGRLEGHTEWGSTAVISPDDDYIFSAGRAEPGQDGPAPATARLWETPAGDVLIGFFGYPSSVVAAIFRPDGDELLTSDGNTVYIWPAPLVQVFAAAFAEPIGVQVPVPSATSTGNATPTPNATPSPTATRAATPTQIPTVTLTPTPSDSTVALDIFCTVIADRLNLRPGPGTAFNPPLTTLEAGTLLVVVGRNDDASWLQVVVLDDDLNPEFTGWVSTDFVFCIGEINDAPVVE